MLDVFGILYAMKVLTTRYIAGFFWILRCGAYPQMCDYSLIFNQLINMTYAYYFSIKWYI